MNNYKKPSIFARIRKNFLLLLAIAGIIWGTIFSFATGTDRTTPSNSLTTPPISPFEHNIAGIGFVESSSRNINIGSFAPGIVFKVMISEGDKVNQGDTLFVLDQRTALAEVQNRQDALAVAESALALSKVELADNQDRLDRAQGLKSGRSISQEDLKKRHFAVEKAKADITIKETMITQNATALQLAEIALEKTMIKSPIDGMVLKVRIAPGEFISGNEQDSNSPILLGSTHPLHVRVQIDENDIWRFDSTLGAYAFLRSNKNINLPLSFVRTEPYALAKGNLTGVGNELVDTRIIEIIYRIDSDIDNLYIGQHLDVFIESKNSP